MCDHRERLASARAIPAEAGPNHRRFAPEGGVRFRRRGVEGAAGTEAAVDEDGEAVRAENEVGFHAEGLQPRPFAFSPERGTAAPAGDAVGAEERYEAQLGGCIAPRADGGHHGGVFSPGEGVRICWRRCARPDWRRPERPLTAKPDAENSLELGAWCFPPPPGVPSARSTLVLSIVPRSRSSFS